MTDYEKFISEIFDRMKCKDVRDPLVCLPIRNTENELIAFLRPITKEFRKSDAYLPALMTKWRIENPTISTGIFVPNEDRTAKWLDDLVIGRPDRMLFTVQSLKNEPLGHIGYSNFNFTEGWGELDSVLRGDKKAMPGLMTFATFSLMKWGYSTLKMKQIKLSCFSDNDSAVTFYKRMGFTETGKKPLFKAIINGEEKLEIAPPDYSGPIEKYYLHMTYLKGDLNVS